MDKEELVKKSIKTLIDTLIANSTDAELDYISASAEVELRERIEDDD